MSLAKQYFSLAFAPFFALAAIPAQSAPSVTSQQRTQLLARALVWEDSAIEQKDLLQGPGQLFRFNETVYCDYAGKPDTNGMTPKFLCRLSNGQEVKVKYGAGNGEVYGEVMGSRLFWALGFAADMMYPVKVVCNGCSNDPWHHEGDSGNVATFYPAVIEEKYPGKTIEAKEDQGWSFSELEDITSDSAGGATRAERDSLRLLAAFVQHGDNKTSNQKIVCTEGGLPQGASSLAECMRPMMFVSDLGSTFGKGAQMGLILAKSKANLSAWAGEDVWKSERKCKANLDMINAIFFQHGTLKDPVISEEGRMRLSNLMSRLTDSQLEDMFRASRIELRGEIIKVNGQSRPATVQDWVRVFRRKQAEIDRVRCPD